MNYKEEKNITIFEHPLIQHKISLLRDKNTGTNEFRKLVEEIAMLEGFEAMGDLELKDVEIETPIEKCMPPMVAGRKLAIVKDSYGNALVPCLTGSFEDIYVVDARYFEVNAISQFTEWGITDLLFAMNTFSATGSNFECIEQIRTQ